MTSLIQSLIQSLKRPQIRKIVASCPERATASCYLLRVALARYQQVQSSELIWRASARRYPQQPQQQQSVSAHDDVALDIRHAAALKSLRKRIAASSAQRPAPSGAAAMPADNSAGIPATNTR